MHACIYRRSVTIHAYHVNAASSGSPVASSPDALLSASASESTSIRFSFRTTSRLSGIVAMLQIKTAIGQLLQSDTVNSPIYIRSHAYANQLFWIPRIRLHHIFQCAPICQSKKIVHLSGLREQGQGAVWGVQI